MALSLFCIGISFECSVDISDMSFRLMLVFCFVLFQEKRLRDRKTESEESLQKRLHAAQVDMEFSKCFCSVPKD